MKAIKEAQNLDINDNCTTCGSTLDIGAVINEEDNVLEIKLDLTEQAELEVISLVSEAQKQFETVKYTIDKSEHSLILKLEFDVAVEKMLFQIQKLGL
ncbi:DUF406 family protein [Shewanella sp. 202IG2-18]|uniref:DUF406 family protein n=1 Tax=Parashewanella hymeniacidonis TaxID=2807618 RepID=UPI001960D47F|nr:DUF406 family protein [Parashewanella hymeniacidonis]MBM7074054.1 DUF406 family protein [Parashewanella hymeniacidonis]